MFLRNNFLTNVVSLKKTFVFFGSMLLTTVCPSGIGYELTEFTSEVEVTAKPLIHIVRASVYNATPGQTDDTPNITADGSLINMADPKSHKWIAVSRDLIRENCLKFGDRVRIFKLDAQGNEIDFAYSGTYEVHDLMNKRYHRSIDFLTNDTVGLWTRGIYMEPI